MKTPMDKYLSHPVALAVEPLRADAIKSAEDKANATVEYVRKALAEAGNDINAVAPYPPGTNYGSRENYHRMLAKYRLFSSLAKWRKSTYNPFDGPCLADVAPEAVARMIKNYREAAVAQYDMFIAKLVNKIGPATSATLSGNHIWGWSFLTVTLPSGETQVWKTMQISNVSKLGKYFPQWPSRKVKVAIK